MTLKVTGHRIGQVDGVDCVIVTTDEGTEAAIPIPAINRMNADALHHALRVPSEERVQGTHLRVRLVKAQTVMVSTMPTETGDAIAILANKDTDMETGLSLQVEFALQLGRLLIEEAQRASPTPPMKN